MLKKFLTTIIVLAATATAWAQNGTYGTGENTAVISSEGTTLTITGCGDLASINQDVISYTFSSDAVGKVFVKDGEAYTSVSQGAVFAGTEYYQEILGEKTLIENFISNAEYVSSVTETKEWNMDNVTEEYYWVPDISNTYNYQLLKTVAGWNTPDKVKLSEIYKVSDAADAITLGNGIKVAPITEEEYKALVKTTTTFTAVKDIFYTTDNGTTFTKIAQGTEKVEYNETAQYYTVADSTFELYTTETTIEDLFKNYSYLTEQKNQKDFVQILTDAVLAGAYTDVVFEQQGESDVVITSEIVRAILSPNGVINSNVRTLDLGVTTATSLDIQPKDNYNYVLYTSQLEILKYPKSVTDLSSSTFNFNGTFKNLKILDLSDYTKEYKDFFTKVDASVEWNAAHPNVLIRKDSSLDDIREDTDGLDRFKGNYAGIYSYYGTNGLTVSLTSQNSNVALFVNADIEQIIVGGERNSNICSDLNSIEICSDKGLTVDFTNAILDQTNAVYDLSGITNEKIKYLIFPRDANFASSIETNKLGENINAAFSLGVKAVINSPCAYAHIYKAGTLQNASVPAEISDVQYIEYSGEMNSDDVDIAESYTNTLIDFKNVDFDGKFSFTNNTVKYLVLPNITSDDEISLVSENVDEFSYSDCESLIAVAEYNIDSEKKSLTMHSKSSKANSDFNDLTSMQVLNYMYTGGEANNPYRYTDILTMSGYLCALDITNDNSKNGGLTYLISANDLTVAYYHTQVSGVKMEENKVISNVAGVQTFDLTNAYFPTQEDMTFNKGYSFAEIKLPVDSRQTLIPSNAFENQVYFSELCIPYNYTKIGSEAFYLSTQLCHIYTTDNPADDEETVNDNATIVDNGLYTFTFSANLKEIEGPVNSQHSTFCGYAIELVTDIYNLALDAPLCGAGTFDASMAYGDNGFAGDIAHPIGRHNYQNHSKIFVMLHYPSECTDEQAKKYTDITRKYTLADETGEVDGKGRPRMWPRHVEFGAAYNNALNGVIWDQTTEYDTRYQGWHEIVLVGNSLARDYDPQSENTEFVQRDWLTICVPYNLKRSQVLSLLGVDPRGGKDEVTTLKNEVITTEQPLYPDVRALTHVSRSVDNRKMTLHFAKLIEQEEGTVKLYDVEIEGDHGQGFKREEMTEEDPVVMQGGHPYLIRAYVPAAWNEQIKNLGMYIMSAASSANHAEKEMGVSAENLPYQYGKCTVSAGNVELYLPCLKHKVHAFDADEDNTIQGVKPGVGNGDFSYTDTGKENPILYHFIGTYTSTKIPQYGYYIGKAKDGSHKFSRTTRTGDAAYTWAPYTAVIVGLSDPTYDTDAFGNTASGSNSTGSNAISVEGSIDNIVVNPGVDGDDLKIYVGEDEKLGTSGARLSLGGFDNSAVTGIVDVNVNEKVNISNNKVYSINGQYMGTSLNNLPKGIYIINGQKKVVK